MTRDKTKKIIPIQPFLNRSVEEKQKVADIRKLRESVGKKRTLYVKTDKDCGGYEYFRELRRLCMELLRTDKLREAQEACFSLAQLAVELDEEYHDIASREALAISFDILGDLKKKQGRPKAAIEYYRKGAEFEWENTAQSDEWETKWSLSVSYVKMGEIHLSEGQLASAEECLLVALGLCKPVALESGEVEMKKTLAYIYNQFGLLRRKEERLPEACDYYGMALELCTQIAEETGTVRSKGAIFSCYISLGDIRSDEDSPQEAVEYYRMALELCGSAAESEGSVVAREHIPFCYGRLGMAYLQMNDREEAGRWFGKCLESGREIAEETGSAYARESLAFAYEQAGELEKNPKKKEYLKTALRIWRELVEQYPECVRYQEEAEDLEKCLELDKDLKLGVFYIIFFFAMTIFFLFQPFHF